AEVERFVTLGDLRQVDDRMATVLDIEGRLNSYQDLADLYCNREEIFGLPRSEYPALEDVRKAFTPSADLWRIASEFARSLPEWLDGPFTEIDAETVAADVDRWWRATAKLAKQLDKEPGEVVAAVRGKLEDFQVGLAVLETFQKANETLEKIQKNLEDYLETKRMAFPRFYFLSNDELLEILSETKDPLRVQPFLRKIFEGISALEFQPNGDVTAMFSEEGERVEFKTPFNPRDSLGNVERWLIECEIAMRSTLKDTILRAFNDFTRTPRVQWVTSWPGQVVICVDCMYWTRETAEAIAKHTLGEYAQQCTDELMKHCTDELMKRCASAGGGGPKEGRKKGMGCYRTLMGALHLNLGGAPEG
ncbi:Dynein heavy chain 3, axonemal, partial [Tetrabaena socialis]